MQDRSVHLPQGRPGSRGSWMVEWGPQGTQLCLASFNAVLVTFSKSLHLLKSIVLSFKRSGCHKNPFDCNTDIFFLSSGTTWKKQVCVDQRLELHKPHLLMFGWHMNGSGCSLTILLQICIFKDHLTFQMQAIPQTNAVFRLCGESRGSDSTGLRLVLRQLPPLSCLAGSCDCFLPGLAWSKVLPWFQNRCLD